MRILKRFIPELVVLAALLVAIFATPVDAQYLPPVAPGQYTQAGFQPWAKTSAVAASTTSASIALASVPITPATNGGNIAQVQVYNATAQSAFVVFCLTSPCTASAGSTGTSTTDYPVAPGAVVVITVPAGTTYGAAVLSSGSGTVYFTPGIGL